MSRESELIHECDHTHLENVVNAAGSLIFALCSECALRFDEAGELILEDA